MIFKFNSRNPVKIPSLEPINLRPIIEAATKPNAPKHPNPAPVKQPAAFPSHVQAFLDALKEPPTKAAE